jgi:hypothetical protein
MRVASEVASELGYLEVLVGLGRSWEVLGGPGGSVGIY